MKSIFTGLICLVMATFASGQSVNYALDTTLANQLGVDQYGMKI